MNLTRKGRGAGLHVRLVEGDGYGAPVKVGQGKSRLGKGDEEGHRQDAKAPRKGRGEPPEGGPLDGATNGAISKKGEGKVENEPWMGADETLMDSMTCGFSRLPVARLGFGTFAHRGHLWVSLRRFLAAFFSLGGGGSSVF